VRAAAKVDGANDEDGGANRASIGSPERVCLRRMTARNLPVSSRPSIGPVRFSRNPTFTVVFANGGFVPFHVIHEIRRFSVTQSNRDVAGQRFIINNREQL
jgi:hypothetical protein